MFYCKVNYFAVASETKYSGHGGEYVSQDALDFDVITVVGGDGMFNEIINSAIQRPDFNVLRKRLSFAAVPAGNSV